MNKYKQNITPRNDKNQAHGYWKQYWGSMDLYYEGTYVNGQRHGYEEWSDGEKRFYLI